MEVVKEQEAVSTEQGNEQGNEQANAPAGMNKQQFMAYKKALKEEVEMLELEARRLKAQVEYFIYGGKLEEIHKAIANIEKGEKVDTPDAAKPKTKMGLWTPNGEV